MMHTGISEDMLDAALEACASTGADVPEREVMRAALAAAFAHSDGGVEWYLFQAWSARSEDGKLVPKEPISGAGLHSGVVSGKPGYLEAQRALLEDLGRIGRGASYFCVEAPFKLMKGNDE